MKFWKSFWQACWEEVSFETVSPVIWPDIYNERKTNVKNTGIKTFNKSEKNGVMYTLLKYTLCKI